MPGTALAKDGREVFVNHFEQYEKAALGGPDAWVLQLRKSAIGCFHELGLPTTAHEEWKYTSLAALATTDFIPAGRVEVGISAEDLRPFDFSADTPLIVFINGRYAPALSRLTAVEKGVRVCPLSEAIRTDADLVRTHLGRHARFERQAMTALNTSLMNDGAFVHVARGAAIERPIHVLYLTASDGRSISAHPRTLIVADTSAQATVVETFAGLGSGTYLCNPVTEVVAGENAVIDHYKVTREREGAVHVATLHLQQQRSSNVKSHAVTLGRGLVRNDIGTVLSGEGCDCHLYGMYYVDSGDHVDNHLEVDHAAAHCDSREFFKGVLSGRGRGIFSGKIIVREGAQKTDAKQTNMSLLLSDEAQVESKPQLEIFADDVKCTHGATIGQVSSDAMFYLRSRGISEEAARSILVYAFAREGIDNVKIESLREQLEAVLFERLPEGRQLAGAV